MKTKKKISVKLALVIGVLQIVLLTVIFLLLNTNITQSIRLGASDNMKVVARNHASIVDQFLSRGPDYLDSFAINEPVQQLLLKPNDEELLKKAQQITDKYALENPALEGIYIADWDGNVLTHSNHDVIGIQFTSGERLVKLQAALIGHDGAFCYGVGVRHVMSSFRCIYDNDKNPIGMVGLAYYLTDLESILNSLYDEGLETAEHTILDTVNNRYVFDSHKEGQPGVDIEDPELLELIDIMKEKKEEKVFVDSETDTTYYAAAYYEPVREWVYVVYEEDDKILHDVYKIRRMLFFIVLLFAILFPLVSWLMIAKVMKPLDTIRETISKLDRDDYSKNPLMEALAKREDEFGAISNVVEKLSESLESKNEVYTEMLKTQSSGFLSLTYDTEDIVLINLAAIQLLGIDTEHVPKNAEGLFDEIGKANENNSEKLKDIVDTLRLNEVETANEYEVVRPDHSSVFTLVHGKCVELSTKKKVLMLSITDITEKKAAEDKLIELSETDALTGLLNRRKGEEIFARFMQNEVKGLFILLDVNKFKYVNDTFGHQVGDEVLVELARTMQRTFRNEDICVRLGGDEYLVFAAHIGSKDIAESVINRFMGNVEKISLSSIGDHKITISLGAVLCDEPITFAEAYAKADSLMYECKEKGGNAYLIY